MLTQAANDSNMTAVSVVLPTWGRLDQLDSCLDALTRQTLSPDRYEIIVVDDDPDHNTLHLVSGWRARMLERGPRMLYLSNAGPHGAAAARNRGWRVARAPIVAFTDDATIPAPDWLEQALAAFGEYHDAVCGKIAMPLAAIPTEYQRDARRKESAEFACANFLCRRAILEAIDGFDERFNDADCGESDLHFRLLLRPASIGHAALAEVALPLRPPPWGTSVSALRQHAGKALLFKKHPLLYRQRLQEPAPWDCYAITLMMLATIAGMLAGTAVFATGAALAWLLLTVRLCRRRLRGTSRRPAHVIEIVVTSAVIPPLAVFWRLAGALRYRVRFA